jgi:pyruvate dehydrogenase E2 component (dihydrolipoamide acetyltransferase)
MRFMSGGDDFPTHELVKLPALSPTMEHGSIVTWEKKVGDQLGEGDLLCEIETDKATMGFETPEEGYLAKILIEAGTKDIPIGKPLCIIVTDKDDISKFESYLPPTMEEAKPEAVGVVKPTPQPAAAAPPVRSPVTPQGGSSRAFASPAAKKLGVEKGIDITQIAKGSGMDGMITAKDVESFKGAPMGAAGATAVGVAPPGRKLGGMVFPMGSGHTDAELTGMRKTIAKRLQASKHEIPHYYLTVECEVDSLMTLRADLNRQYMDEGIKLSVNDFIIKATALASRRVPECNSAWMDTFIRQHHTCDVSVAVDTGNGLITPIVTSADAKGLAEISSDIKELAARAKEGKLQPNEFMGGTITVSNLGMFGISHFTAIINPPQSCILAVGGPKKKVLPSSSGDGYKTVNTVSVTLSCDHRVVDGAVGAQWLKHFKRYLEQPTSMLL